MIRFVCGEEGNNLAGRCLIAGNAIPQSPDDVVTRARGKVMLEIQTECVSVFREALKGPPIPVVVSCQCCLGAVGERVIPACQHVGAIDSTPELLPRKKCIGSRLPY